MERPPPMPAHLAHLEPVVVRALAREPADRWPSALDLRHALFEAAGGPVDHHATQPVRAPIADPGPELKLFVHCGDRFPPDRTWEALPLPASLTRQDLAPAVRAVRTRLRDVRHAQILIAGPICLGVALGMALEHIPTRVDFIQLNQRTKELEPWVSTTEHWE